MKVYILSTHEEHGAEDVRATLDTLKLYEMLNDFAPTSEERAKLAELVKANILNPDFGSSLGNGWGGVQLHIVELEV